MASRLKERAAPSSRVTRRTSKNEGKPFYPYAMLHDTIMSLAVVLVIIALAFVWYFTAGDTEEGKVSTGILGPFYAEKADPGTFEFVPRPDWFFCFLFYLLRIFKWPASVVLGTVGIPTLLMILLIGLPFYDPAASGGRRRPVAMVAAVPHRHLDGRAHLEGRHGRGGTRLELIA